MTTEKTTKPSTHPCGFCSTGHHELCPHGILNGDGVTIILCGCKEHGIRATRCVDCNELDYSLEPEHWEIDPITWQCIDQEACLSRRERRIRAAREALYGREPGEALPVIKADRPVAPKVPAKSKTGACLHCGEPTKGGLFLPGHDSSYLSAAVKTITEHPNPEGMLIATLDGWASQGISEALRAKLAKRVSA